MTRFVYWLLVRTTFLDKQPVNGLHLVTISRNFFLVLFASLGIALAFAGEMSSSADRPIFHQAMVVAGCTSPRMAARGGERHSCRNEQVDASLDFFRDICTNRISETETGYVRYGGKQACADFLRPEWETVAVAGGVGMHGIFPSGCGEIRGSSSLNYPRQPPPAALGAVVAIRNESASGAETLGTGVLIAPGIVLTAYHVVVGSGSESDVPAYAVFGHRNRDEHPPMSHEELTSSRILKDSQTKNIKLLYWSRTEDLDFAVFEIEKLDAIRKVVPLPIRTKLQMEAAPLWDRPTIVGYTDNPFFPRGLVVSTDGRWNTKPVAAFAEVTNDLFYSLNTAGGFSGAPVFNSNFEWVGLHLVAHSGDYVTKRGDACIFHTPKTESFIRDFNRPNGGQSLNRIFEHIANQSSNAEMKEIFGSEEIASAIASYRSQQARVLMPQSPGKAGKADVPFRTWWIGATPTPSRPLKASETCGASAQADPATGSCRAPLVSESAQSAIPHSARSKRFAVGAIVAKMNDGKDQLVATGVMLSNKHVLTAGHSVPVPAAISGYRFVLDWSRSGDQHLKCRVELPILPRVFAGSARSRLDYALLELATPAPLARDDGSCQWELLELAPYSPRVTNAGAKAFALGHYFADYERPLSLFYRGVFAGEHRWSKDGGGSLNLDYSLPTEEGLSGGAVLDQSFRLVGLHQRSLKRARETRPQTAWHPYNQWTYGLPSWRNLWRPFPVACGPESLSRDPNDCFPGQGTLISDIAQDAAMQMGHHWMCKNVPKLARLFLAQVSSTSPACSSEVYQTATELILSR